MKIFPVECSVSFNFEESVGPRPATGARFIRKRPVLLLRKCTEPFTRSHGSRGPAAGGVPVDFAPPAPPSSQAERGACLAPLLNDLDFSPNADAERGKRRNFHCLTFQNLVGLRAARRRFQCQENSSCFLGGKRAAKKESSVFDKSNAVRQHRSHQT